MKLKLLFLAICLAASPMVANASAQQSNVATKAAANDAIEFESPVKLTVGDSPIKVESPGYACPSFADMDGDGLKDLLVGQFAGGKIRVFKNLGKQGFAEGQWLKADGAVAEVPGVWWCTSSTPQVVDLNQDGHMDILSGSYSRMEKNMAGTFQVLWGTEEGFKVAETLNGTDDEPLIIPASEEQMTEKICTRPFAADIDNDGDLDLVVGNFGGTFYTFAGEGKGIFSPTATKLEDQNGKRLSVQQHSDPFLVDWDADGDLDLASGSSGGGVSLAINEGTNAEHSFAAFEEIIASFGRSYGAGIQYGSDHITQPQASTRVWVDDVNGDGKFDLLVGDSVSISTIADGVKEEDVDQLMKEWQKDYSEISEAYMKASEKLQTLSEKRNPPKKEAAESETGTEDKKEKSPSQEEADEDSVQESDLELEKLQADLIEWQEKLTAAYEKRKEIVNQEMTGFVWVYYQK